VPGLPRPAVAADVLAVASEGEHHQALVAEVHELAALGGPDAHQLAASQQVLLAVLEDQCELALEHEVDLLLLEVRVHAAALARLEGDQVDAEARHAQLPP